MLEHLKDAQNPGHLTDAITSVIIIGVAVIANTGHVTEGTVLEGVRARPWPRQTLFSLFGHLTPQMLTR